MATTHYVAPKGATISGTPNGTKENPWRDPSKALSVAKAGDTILLMDGNYDGLIVKQRAFSSPVTIRSMNDKKARLERISIEDGSQNITFQNLSVWPSDTSTSKANRLQTGNSVKDIVFDGLDVRGDRNAASYPGWTKAQWEEHNMKGIHSRGVRVTIKNSTFTGLGFAVVLEGPQTKAVNNSIRGFSHDGLRVLGNESVIKGNLITDCVRINSNHPDGIQSWSVGGKPVDGLLIEGNAIIEWSNPTKSSIGCGLQGIGFFDGFYDNIVIRNNIVAITAYHGISVYGGRNLSIINNTVVNIGGKSVEYPFIKIADHKNGTPPSNVTRANNLAMQFSRSDKTINFKSNKNSVILSPAKVFVDIAKFDYRLKSTSTYIDSGDATFAPSTDVRDHRRPAGAGPDRGAYEMNSTPATQDSGSSTTSTTSTAGKWLSAP
jgi:hypothetical protein